MDFKAMLGSMQKKLQDIKEKKESARYKGQAGGGAVVVTLDGNCKIISEETSASSELKNEDPDVIMDMFVAAYNNAKELAQKDSDSSESDLLQGLPLPFNMKKPPF